MLLFNFCSCLCCRTVQTNESIRRQLSRQHTIVDRVRRRKLKLFGHICRMPDNRTLKSVVWGGGRSQLPGTTKKALGRRHTEVVRHDTTTGVTSCTGSRDVEESHSWPLRFLNHGTRRRRRRRRSRTVIILSCTTIWQRRNE